MEHAGDQRLADRIGRDRGYEAVVELHVVGAELDDMAEAGVPGPRVVDRPRHPAKPLDGPPKGNVIVDRLPLRDLEDQGTLAPAEQRCQPPLLHHEPWRQVDADARVRRQRACRVKRGR